MRRVSRHCAYASRITNHTTMGIQFFIVFALSIAFLSMGVTGGIDIISVTSNSSFVFSTDKPFDSDLDNQIIPIGLKQEFENNSILFSENVTASIKIEGQRWLITDKIRTYTIQRESDSLTIYKGHLPHLHFSIVKCVVGVLLFLGSMYLMGFFLYLEERESGRIMKNVKSFVRFRTFLERQQQK